MVYFQSKQFYTGLKIDLYQLIDYQTKLTQQIES
jgi:hypothetical protein